MNTQPTDYEPMDQGPKSMLAHAHATWVGDIHKVSFIEKSRRMSGWPIQPEEWVLLRAMQTILNHDPAYKKTYGDAPDSARSKEWFTELRHRCRESVWERLKKDAFEPMLDDFYALREW